MDKTLHLYVNLNGHAPCFPTIGAALKALGECPCAEKAFPAPDEDIEKAVIHVGAGVYRERLTVSRPYVTLEGAGAEQTILVSGNAAKERLEDGSLRGTFRTATLRVDAHDFTARGMTFQNDAGYGHTVGQALALYVDADRCLFEDCRLLGSQDTLFTAPLPPTEAKPGGFKGPGQTKPRFRGRHCYLNCYIRGDVDFIFGSATAYFENCTVFSQKPGDRVPPESPAEEVIYGYVTAASTPEGVPFGYVFRDCRLLSDCPPRTVYLGRPWREYAKTVFLHCELGAHIHPLGWDDWGKPHGHFYYGEYDSYGPGASPGARAGFSRLLTQREAAKYTVENILDGWEFSSYRPSTRR